MLDDIDFNDHCTRSGAARIAQRIEDYWIARGFDGIRTGVIEFQPKRYIVYQNGTTHFTRASIFCVRSNIGPNGYPPRIA